MDVCATVRAHLGAEHALLLRVLVRPSECRGNDLRPSNQLDLDASTKYVDRRSILSRH